MKETYSIDEANTLLRGEGAPTWWLREGCRQGKFPHLKVARQTRFTRAHLDEIQRLVEHRPVAVVKPQQQPGMEIFGAASAKKRRAS
ncbi:hypothetical protein LWF01_02685 [Saxibacter everestensis]|uniref:DNA-binding protein n=1 Tax=Saxibacter everestensis TaxID=2909229 RepID=A0ABY8QUJ3_9MICO|nr:hypothetical protein LWF01_02685 [Brevibacteriaceae bacterium ZFBP1038]